MLEGKRRRTTLQIALLAWLLSGVALSVLLVPAPVESFIVDDTLGIDEVPDSQGLQGTPPPFWPFAAGREIRNAPCLRLLRLPSFPATRDSLTGAIFRLKLVRLHPPVGPPGAFFAEQRTG